MDEKSKLVDEYKDQLKYFKENPCDDTFKKVLLKLNSIKGWIPGTSRCTIQALGLSEEEKDQKAPFRSPQGKPFFPMLLKARTEACEEPEAFIPLFFNKEALQAFCKDAEAGVCISFAELMRLAVEIEEVKGVVVDPFESPFILPIHLIEQALALLST